MARDNNIHVVRDPQIEQSDVVVPIERWGASEVDPVTMHDDVNALNTYGITSPLISINNIIIEEKCIVKFKLDGCGHIPTVTATVIDSANKFRVFDPVTSDNEMIVQILPRTDTYYKKIKLTFYITKFQVRGETIDVAGVYKLPQLSSSVIQGFGEMTTYKLLEKIATDLNLGIVTNIGECDPNKDARNAFMKDENRSGGSGFQDYGNLYQKQNKYVAAVREESEVDKRWIYCDNISYVDLMAREVELGGDVENNLIYDYWIDFWNYMNIMDIYDRYTNIDVDENMILYSCAGQTDANATDEDIEKTYVMISPVALTNADGMEQTDLYIRDLDKHSTPGNNYANGSDRVLSVYEENRGEYLDHLFQNSEVKKDIYTKYIYGGEIYGDNNFFLNRELRADWLRKVKSNYIIVDSAAPCVGIMRGQQIRVEWIIHDDAYVDALKNLAEDDLINEKRDTNVPKSGIEEGVPQNGTIAITDETVSGQYLVWGINLIYKDGFWHNELTLVRPPEAVPRIIKSEE